MVCKVLHTVCKVLHTVCKVFSSNLKTNNFLNKDGNPEYKTEDSINKGVEYTSRNRQNSCRIDKICRECDFREVIHIYELSDLPTDFKKTDVVIPKKVAEKCDQCRIIKTLLLIYVGL